MVVIITPNNTTEANIIMISVLEIMGCNSAYSLLKYVSIKKMIISAMIPANIPVKILFTTNGFLIKAEVAPTNFIVLIKNLFEYTLNLIVLRISVNEMNSNIIARTNNTVITFDKLSLIKSIASYYSIY